MKRSSPFARPIAFLVLAVVGSLTAFASPALQQQQSPAFRSGVAIVRLAVTVLDAERRPVRDLAASDFEIIEDGQPQRVALLQAIDIGSPNDSTVNEPAGPEIFRVSDSISHARALVIFLDDVHIAGRDTAAARRCIRQIGERVVGPLDVVAVGATSGRAELTLDFSTDRQRLFRVADSFLGLKPPSEPFLDAAHDARATMGALAGVAARLANVHGRRINVLFVSSGIEYNTYNPSDMNAADVLRAIEGAISALRQTDITLYAIDPRGLTTVEEDDPRGLSILPRHDQVTTELTKPDARANLRLGIENLRHLSERTGGFAAVNANDLRPALERIAAESAFYYVVGYYSSGTEQNRRRDIEVKVRRAAVQVAARHAYVSTAAAHGSRPSEAPPAIIAALNDPLPQGDLPLAVQTLCVSNGKKRCALQVIVEVPPEAMQSSGDEDIEFAMLTVDSHGRRANGASVTIDATPSQRDQLILGGARWLRAVVLSSGRYNVRIAARGKTSGRVGAVFVDIDVPRFDEDAVVSPIGLSSPAAAAALTVNSSTVISQLPGPLTTRRQFALGEKVSGVAEVCGGKLKLPTSATLSLRRVGVVGSPVIGTIIRIMPTPTNCEYLTFALDTMQLGLGEFVAALEVPTSSKRPEVRQVRFSVQ